MPHKICLFLLAGLLLAGCNPIETGKKIYQGNMLPARIDLEQETGLAETEQSVARVLAEADEEIEKLRLALTGLGEPPPLDWMQARVRSMSWLNGLQVLDAAGRRGNHYPQTLIKKMDFQDIHTTVSNSGSKRIRLVLQETSFGDEVCLVKPFFSQGGYQGLILAHFDFRTLIAGSSKEQEIIVLVPGKPLWAGDQGQIAQELSEQNWDQLLEDDIQGEIRLGQASIYWLARYIGLDPLIYAVAVE